MRLNPKCRGLIASIAALIILGQGGVAPASARPLVTGITDPGSTQLDSPLVFSRIRGAGARFVEIPAFWQEIAPATKPTAWSAGDPADPNYNWSTVDAAVGRAVDAGLIPLLQLAGAPSWAQRCSFGNSNRWTACNPDPDAFAQFAKAAARRYGGNFEGKPRVRYWEPQNEPNLKLFFNPVFRHGRPVSPTLYRTLLNKFSEAVKSVDPSNRVVAAGLAPLGTMQPLRFARLLLCLAGRRHPHRRPGGCRGGVHFDIFGIHPYTTGGPTHRSSGPDTVAIADLPKLQRVLRAADRAGVTRGSSRHTPLWVTEFAWDSKPPDPGGLPMRIHARWAAEAIYRAWKAGVSHFFWFELRDGARNGLPFNESIQSGLYLRGATVESDRPKRTLEAFRFPFVAFKRGKGFSVWGRTPDSQGGSVRISIHTKRGWHKVDRVTAKPSGIFSGFVGPRRGVGPHTLVRAEYRGEGAVPFSLHNVKDFYQPPFG